MTTFLEIAVLAPSVKSIFHYHLPDGVEDVHPGSLVVVPFGTQKIQGVVLGTVPRPEVPETRAVESLLDPLPVFTPSQLHLAKWMADYYRATLDSCLSAMLPPGLARHAEGMYELVDENFRPEKPIAQRLLKLLRERGTLRAGQIRAAFGPVEWEREAERLVRSGVIHRKSILPPPSVRPKKIRMVQLAVSRGEADAAIATLQSDSISLARKPVAQRRARVLEAILAEGRPLAVEWVYASSNARLEDVKWLAEGGWVDIVYEEMMRDPLSGRSFAAAEAPVLTGEQDAALQSILTAMDGRNAERFLLFGITGSGKTEVYLRAAEETVRRGRQAIVLVPEIALTPQMVQRFGGRFPGRLGLVHSLLSPGERYDVWRRARTGNLDVVLGPRSALFSPLPDIGLIVMDEEHDESYKAGSAPFYHAREAAGEYARSLRAVCLLGSATPDLCTYHQAETGRIRLARLTRRVSMATPAGRAPELPPVEIVDMRQELRAGNRSMFSRPLFSALESCLNRKEQAILFLNRRGMASAIVCRTCGKSVECPRCALPLTSHGEELLCHHCNYRRKIPGRCPSCGGTAIRPLGVGTRQVEAEVKRLFPGARTLRWDRDSVAEAGEHDILLEHFASHRADVLIGTQMVAKGLDLPQVTLVGIMLAELGLLLPDYRSPERIFQVLGQVAGRAGRAAEPGKVVLQTYLPEHYALQCAAAHDFPGFARIESEHRRALGYPPFQNLLRIVFVNTNEALAEQNAQTMAETLRARIVERELVETSLSGPVPCFFAKIGGRYRWQIILRGPSPAALIELPLPEGCHADVDPVTLL
jgi:primosomal protein N' (replication factor Y) (superfamily II helicase)